MKKEGAKGMKRPDEIKKGLEYLSIKDIVKKLDMWKEGIAYDYAEDAATDALALIQRLERDNAWASENYDLIREENKRLKTQNSELVQKVKQLEKERDALLNIMKGYMECDLCKHGCPPEKEENLFDLCDDCDIENCRCRNCTTKNNCWEWCGPCEENGGSNA